MLRDTFLLRGRLLNDIKADVELLRAPLFLPYYEYEEHELFLMVVIMMITMVMDLISTDIRI